MAKFRTIEVSDSAMEPGDGLRFITVKSAHLRARGDMSVFVPPGSHAVPLPIVTLLHGVYGSCWVWPFKASAHRTAAKLIEAGEVKPFVLAMPSDGLWGDGSGYLPHAHADYDRWIVDDVPNALMEAGLPVAEASTRFISGLSMGGYGALRLGAKYPDRFEAISGLSSITDFPQMKLFVEEDLSAYDVPQNELSVAELMIRNKDRLPRVRFDCGSSDLLIEHNRKLHAQLDEAGVEHVYEEFPGGHEWPYWTKHLAKTLRFFLGK